MMLYVFVFAVLIAVSTTHCPTLQSTDKGQCCDSLFPHILRLERTVAVLSTKLDDVESLKSDMKTVQSELRKVQLTKLEDVESVKSDLKKVESELKKKDADLAALRRTVAKMHSDVAYEAALPSHLTNVRDNEVFKFSTVSYNRGSGYNKNTGIFTAPVSGTYMLWAHILLLDSNYLYVYINKEGEVIGKSFIPGGRIDTASITTAAYLNKGDRVWLTKTGSSKLNGNGFSYYGGTLLHAH